MVRELSSEKRERFLRAALKLFAVNGIQNTSTAEIATAAGTASGTLFLYFPTKQALIDELAILISREEAGHIYRMLEPSMTARDAFYTIWTGSVRWLLENGDAYRFSQQIRDSGSISAAAVQETGKNFLFYYETIQKGFAEGSLKPYPIDLIGGFLYQGIVAVMNYLRTQPDVEKQEAITQKGFEIFWDGISAKKGVVQENSEF
jgi:AcrR family transcriptional regulator